MRKEEISKLLDFDFFETVTKNFSSILSTLSFLWRGLPAIFAKRNSLCSFFHNSQPLKIILKFARAFYLTPARLIFHEDGVCSACRNFELRKSIDWQKRCDSFSKVAENAKAQKQPLRLPYPCQWRQGQYMANHSLSGTRTTTSLRDMETTFKDFSWSREPGQPNKSWG